MSRLSMPLQTRDGGSFKEDNLLQSPVQDVNSRRPSKRDIPMLPSLASAIPEVTVASGDRGPEAPGSAGPSRPSSGKDGANRAELFTAGSPQPAAVRKSSLAVPDPTGLFGASLSRRSLPGEPGPLSGALNGRWGSIASLGAEEGFVRKTSAVFGSGEPGAGALLSGVLPDPTAGQVSQGLGAGGFLPPGANRQERKQAGRQFDVKYVITEFEPPSPTLFLTELHHKAFQVRLAKAGGRHHDHKLTENGSDAGSAQQLPPPMDWYGSQLQQICGEGLVRTALWARGLQALHDEHPGLLTESSSLWPMLQEVASAFSAACFVVHRLVHVLASEAHRANSRAPAALRRLSGLREGAGGPVAVPPAPHHPLPPATPEMAVGLLHTDICRLQAAGSLLGAVLRRLDAPGAVLRTGAAEIRRILKMYEDGEYHDGLSSENSRGPGSEESSLWEVESGSLLEQLLDLVPSVEAAVERCGILTSLAHRWQVAATNTPESLSHSENEGSGDEFDDEFDQHPAEASHSNPPSIGLLSNSSLSNFGSFNPGQDPGKKFERDTSAVEEGDEGDEERDTFDEDGLSRGPLSFSSRLETEVPPPAGAALSHKQRRPRPDSDKKASGSPKSAGQSSPKGGRSPGRKSPKSPAAEEGESAFRKLGRRPQPQG